MCGIAAFQSIFTDATPEYRCRLPQNIFHNDTFKILTKNHQKLVDKYVPFDSKTQKYDNCLFHNLNGSNKTIECDDWVYSNEYYDKTIIMQWNLVCKNAVQKSVFRSIFFAGTFGVILMGILSDRFGRTKILHIFIVMNSLAFILCAMVLNIIEEEHIAKKLFAIIRFAIGFFSNVFALATVLAVEFVGPSYRVAATNTINYFFIFSQFIVLVGAFFIRDFRRFTICMAGFVTAVLSYFWIVPESIR